MLSGIRVLDLTNVLAGPFCCYQLALAGADVIKVEAPGKGDLARQLGADPDLNAALMGASFLAQNAGKRSIAVNLKHPDGKAVLEALVKTADVLVENFRPGVMDRLNLGVDRLRALNPGLVTAAISGFGQTGPLRSNPAYDQIVQGLSGVMSVTGDAETAPLRVGYPVADTIGGLTAAFAIAAALVRRGKTGQGEVIDVSMLEATLVTMGWQVSNWLIAGRAPTPLGNENMTAAPSGMFKTVDGPLNIAANKQEQFEALARLIGRPDLITDPRFSEREARKANRFALRTAIEAALVTECAATWEARLNAAGVPAGRVLTVPEVLDHPQVRDRRLIADYDAVPGVERPVQVVGAGYTTSSSPRTAASPPPTLGADTDTILAELGYTVDQITQLRTVGAIQ